VHIVATDQAHSREACAFVLLIERKKKLVRLLNRNEILIANEQQRCGDFVAYSTAMYTYLALQSLILR
jgi:hypothetical protein